MSVFFLEGGGAERRCFFRDLVFGRGVQCPCFVFFFFGGGGGAPVFLHRFSVWEGETVSFFFCLGGGRSAGVSAEI